MHAALSRRGEDPARLHGGTVWTRRYRRCSTVPIETPAISITDTEDSYMPPGCRGKYEKTKGNFVLLGGKLFTFSPAPL
ncbi:hypothetical protein ppKF707_2046 [Metapseudomonas furukawaii]|uniref:Uncharacterized protein n=1 Tax=Metapseudomonas furukawaii TaxID=1149133 RepID=A0AAD1C5E2_METFU|nr:hypothetical protein ppKF707_2046 [Pseudomonas furukawaii]BAU77040.1 hypothetical protein KF707C_53520 [Pseudomonas furukawaii]